MENERIEVGRRISLTSVIINIALASGKIACGALTGLMSVLADGINNLSDASASVISLIGFRLAGKPADDDHPFGHARSEYIAGLSVAFLVMIAGVELVKSGISRLIAPAHADLSTVTLITLIAALLAKGYLFVTCSRAAKKTGSETIRAVGRDSLNDCAVTSAVIASALIAHTTGHSLDGIMTLLVALFIIWQGCGLIRDTLKPLMGATPPAELVEKLSARILGCEGILGIHDLMVHDYGPGQIFASVHCEVPSEMSLESCHAVIDRIEKDVLSEMRIHLLIHYDPVKKSDELTGKLAEAIKAQGLEIISLHDVRETCGRLYFDAVISPDSAVSDSQAMEMLRAAAESICPGLKAEISIDHGLIELDSDRTM